MQQPSFRRKKPRAVGTGPVLIAVVEVQRGRSVDGSRGRWLRWSVSRLDGGDFGLWKSSALTNYRPPILGHYVLESPFSALGSVSCADSSMRWPYLKI